MNLDEAQRKIVAVWIAEGMKLSDIQNRIATELGLRLTYMDVRLLVDDLKLMPKDVERPKPPAAMLPSIAPDEAAAPAAPTAPDAAPANVALGDVSVKVDHLARPGAVASGKVTFSDGNKADWYIDQSGRLGLAAQKAGYRPTAADVQRFQMLLETELAKLGL